MSKKDEETSKAKKMRKRVKQKDEETSKAKKMSKKDEQTR